MRTAAVFVFSAIGLGGGATQAADVAAQSVIETVTVFPSGAEITRIAKVKLMAGEQRIVAPMPGKIIRILVAPGAEVKARQGVVVIEAMKMECELASPKAGHVKEIAVEVGASVEKGRLLAVVE